MARWLRPLALKLTLATVTALCTTQFAMAQDDAEKSRQEQITDHWLKISRDYAHAAEVTSDAVKLKLHDQPVFRHTQSVRGDDIGALHMWTKPDGRPAIVGVIFAWSDGDHRWVMCEFHSLQNDRVQLSIPGTPVSWTCDDAGLNWQDFDNDTAKPADTASRRWLQSRQLSRRFAAHTIEAEKNRWELRLVPAPIYSYSTDGAGAVDGAVYAFCQGTDTEMLLLIEAVQQSGEWRWRYSLASFTDYDGFVSLDDQPVWQSPDGALGQNGKPHYWNFLMRLPKPEFEK